MKSNCSKIKYCTKALFFRCSSQSWWRLTSETISWQFFLTFLSLLNSSDVIVASNRAAILNISFWLLLIFVLAPLIVARLLLPTLSLNRCFRSSSCMLILLVNTSSITFVTIIWGTMLIASTTRAMIKSSKKVPLGSRMEHDALFSSHRHSDFSLTQKASWAKQLEEVVLWLHLLFLGYAKE